MEAKRIEVSALLRVGHKKSEIAKQLKVSQMTVHRVADHLRNSENPQGLTLLRQTPSYEKGNGQESL